MDRETALSGIIKEGDSWFVFNKPDGMETIVKGDGKGCLTLALRRALGNREIAPAHRLDRDTSGCLLFAKRKSAVEGLENLFREREPEKFYLGLCLGVPNTPNGVIKRKLTEWRGGRRPVQIAEEGGFKAETEFRTLHTTRDCRQRSVRDLAGSLIMFKPHTGRTHQIRVHAASLGLPILGDDQYGERNPNHILKAATGLRRQALHAWRLSFPAPGGIREKVEAPIPADMVAALDGLLPGWREKLPAW